MAIEEIRTLAIALDDETRAGASSAIGSLTQVAGAMDRLASSSEKAIKPPAMVGESLRALAVQADKLAGAKPPAIVSADYTRAITGAAKLSSAIELAAKRSEALRKAEATRDKELFARANRTPTALQGSPAAASGFNQLVQGVGKLLGPGAAGGLVRGAASLAAASDKLGPIMPLLKAGGAVLLTAAAALAAVVVGLGFAAAKLVSGVVSQAVDSAGFKKNTIAGLEALLKSKDAAVKTYAELKQFADLEAPFETKDVAANFKKLLGAGFSSAETKDILRGAFDVAALNDLSKEAADSVVGAIAKIQGQGRLTTDTLQEIINASGGVVGRKGLFAELAKSTGKSVDALEKELAAGKISADQGVKAILETIRTGVSGGELGKLSKQLAGESVPGLLSTIKSQFAGMFEDIDISPLTDTMKNLSGVLSGGFGGEFKTTMTALGTEIFKTLFGPFQGPEGKAKLESLLKTITTMMKTTTEVIIAARPYVAGFVDLLEALFGSSRGGNESGFVGKLKALKDMFASLFNADVIGFRDNFIKAFGLEGLVDMIRDAAANLGSAFASGFANAITGGASSAVNAAVDMVRRAIGGAQAAQDSHSPSRVTAKLGGDFAGGYLRTIAAQNDNAYNAGARFAAAATGGAGDATSEPEAGAGGATAGGAVVININVTAGPGVSSAEAKAQGEAAGEGAHEAWMRSMRRYNRDRIREAG